VCESNTLRATVYIIQPLETQFAPKRSLGYYLFLCALRSFAAIQFVSLPFASLADVAKGGDGAESALREIFLLRLLCVSRSAEREPGFEISSTRLTPLLIRITNTY
jgi:hypothetical protein